MSLEREALACFLDKVAFLYPYGVPASAMAAPSQQTTIECAFILVSTDSAIGSTHSELLDAICTKGLRLNRKACDVRVIPTWPESSPSMTAPLTVVLGAQRKPGTVESSSGGKILYSHSIDQIANQVTLKRDFWSHLQALVRA
jgi:hypothetical protein